MRSLSLRCISNHYAKYGKLPSNDVANMDTPRFIMFWQVEVIRQCLLTAAKLPRGAMCLIKSISVLSCCYVRRHTSAELTASLCTVCERRTWRLYWQSDGKRCRPPTMDGTRAPLFLAHQTRFSKNSENSRNRRDRRMMDKLNNSARLARLRNANVE